MEQAEGAEQVKEHLPESIVVKDWSKDHRNGFVLLKIVCESKMVSMASISVKVEVQNNDKKNVNVPVTEFKDSLLKDDNKAIGLLVKIDPSKETWGDFKLSFSVKSRYSATITSSSNYGGNTFVTSNAYGTTKSYTATATTAVGPGTEDYY